MTMAATAALDEASDSKQRLAIRDRIEVLVNQLSLLLSADSVSYSDVTPRIFPEAPGIYVICDRAGFVLRAGKTSATLRQRLYQNHLMGSQDGNLPAQLVGSGTCTSLSDAKEWIRKNCFVRWLDVGDARERGFLEHFMLAVLEPKFCDKNKQD